MRKEEVETLDEIASLYATRRVNANPRDNATAEGLMAAWADRPDAALRAEPATTLNTRCANLALHSRGVPPGHIQP